MKLTKVKLNDICNLITCGVAKRPNYVESGIPFLSARNVKKQKIIWNNFKFISHKTHEELTKYNKPLKGDILYTRVGSYGEAAIVDDDREFSLFVSLTLIKPKHDIVNNKFLVYFLNSPMGKLLAKKNINSSGVGNLNVGKVRNFEIFLPSLEKQQRIVAKLDAAFAETDKSINITEHKEEEANVLKQVILRKFLKINTNVKKLSDVCDIVRGGSPRQIKKYITTSADGFNWIKISDATSSDKYIFKTKQKIRKEGASRSRIVKEDDLILSNSMSFGRPYIMKTTGCVHDGWLVLSNYQSTLDIQYFYYLLSSPQIIEQFENSATGSTVRNLNIQLVKNVKIHFPSLKEQKRIVTKLDLIFTNIKKIKIFTEKQIVNYQTLKSAMLMKLLKKEVA